MTQAATTTDTAGTRKEQSEESADSLGETPGAVSVGQGSRRPGTDRSGNALERYGGSAFPAFNEVILLQTVNTVFIREEQSSPECQEGTTRITQATIAAMASFKPKDEIEGMIAAQAVAMHFASMNCFRRAMLPGQSDEMASKMRRDGANMARAMTDMVGALDRKRGKAPQVVRVERFVVHDGGQAIVGNLSGVVSGQAALSAPDSLPAMTLPPAKEKVGGRGRRRE